MDPQFPQYDKIRFPAKFIVGLYWKTHILTKYKSTILYGPKILFTEIQAQIKLFSGTNELIALQ